MTLRPRGGTPQRSQMLLIRSAAPGCSFHFFLAHAVLAVSSSTADVFWRSK
jgi:hypothetical protein